MSGGSNPKGFELEEALRRHFTRAGYFVIRGLPYRVAGDDVTDVDLWLYERGTGGGRRRTVVDVKNKRSPKAAERLIWTKGLQCSLGVEDCVVATTDSREQTRILARDINVHLLDGKLVANILQAQREGGAGQLAADEIDGLVRRVDLSRRSTRWRDELLDARGSLLSGFGVYSANRNLAVAGFFAHEAIAAQPGSPAAAIACRLFYLTAAMAAASLDFVLARHAFSSEEERYGAMVRAIRYGETEGVSPLAAVRTAVGLARSYADNGPAVAKQIETRFYTAASHVSAELIADFVARPAVADSLFGIARDLVSYAHESELQGFDAIKVGSRSLLGVVLDFSEVSRAKFASAWVQDGRLEGELFQPSLKIRPASGLLTDRSTPAANPPDGDPTPDTEQ